MGPAHDIRASRRHARGVALAGCDPASLWLRTHRLAARHLVCANDCSWDFLPQTPREREALLGCRVVYISGSQYSCGNVGAVGRAAAFAFLADLAGGAEPALDPMLSMFAPQTDAEVEVPTLEEVCTLGIG